MSKHEVIRRNAKAIQVLTWDGSESRGGYPNCIKVKMVEDPKHPGKTLMQVDHEFVDEGGHLHGQHLLNNRHGSHTEAIHYAMNYARNNAVPIILDFAA